MITKRSVEICVVWSTKYLMQLQKNSLNICVDATYKLLSIGWPVLRSGFYDANSHFHPTAIALARKEDAQTYSRFFEIISGGNYHPVYLMADAAAAITSAQGMIWPGTLRAQCFFHLCKTVKERLKRKPLDEYSDEIFSDIATLQRAGTYEEFMKAARVLNNYWCRRYQNAELRRALATFIESYVRNSANSGWWHGFSPELPRTNNGLESHNRQLKERGTFHRQVPLREFLNIAASNIRITSLLPEHKNPAQKPSITFELFKAAYELQKERRWVIELDDGEGTVLIAAKQSQFASAGIMANLYGHMHSDDEDKHPFACWEEYKDMRSLFHTIRRSALWPNYFFCDCWLACKKKPCKHNVYWMCERQILTYPAELTSEILQPARKRGRPKKVQRGTALRKE